MSEPVTLSRFLDRVGAELIPLRPRSAGGLRKRLGALREGLGPLAMAELGARQIEAYKANRRTRGASPMALRGELGILRRALVLAGADPAILDAPWPEPEALPPPVHTSARPEDLAALAAPGVRFSEPRRRVIRGKVARNYSSQVYDPATRTRTWRTTGTPDLDAARAWVKAARIRSALGEFAPAMEAKLLTAGAALDRWLEAVGPGIRPRTLEEYSSKARAWRAALGGKRLRDVTIEDLERLLARPCAAGPARAPTTRHHERRCLKIFFGWALKRKLIRDNPASALARIKVPTRAIRVLSAEEEEKLLEKASEKIRPIIIFAIESGLRRRTLLALRWEHVFDDGWIRIPAELMKAGEDFAAPLSPRALEVLRAQRGARREASPRRRVFPLERTRVHTLWKRACHATGIQGIRFHDLRKTFFSRQRARGVPFEVAMKLSDHRDVRTALRVYRAIAPAELERAVGRVAGGLARGGA